jgi:Mrp family chromosome partitioning ATPase
VALLDSRKSITFSESLKVPVLGVVENMSGYTINGKAAPNTEVQIAGPAGKTLKATTNDDGEFAITIDIFKEGGGKATADEFGVPFLGALPFDPGFVRGGDDGVHRIVSEPEGPSAIAFAGVVKALQDQIVDADQPGLEIV